MIEDVFVVDAVSHSYNVDRSNFAEDQYAEAITELVLGGDQAWSPEYQRTRESYLRNWKAEETATVLFEESQTDYSLFHPTPISAFKDGMTDWRKAVELEEKYPTRFATYATVDPLGDDPKEELTRQCEQLEDPLGVKVYPSYWGPDGHEGWRMDDPEVAFPIWEHAKDLGLNTISVHKAVPLGPVPMETYKTNDIDEAAAAFPELNFEIVHGGATFSEETGWQIARFPNVYVNLEITSGYAVNSPQKFQEAMQNLLQAGGEHALEQIVWGTGAPAAHPQLLLEAFWDFEFSEMGAMPGSFTIGREEKRKILGENFAEMHNLDVEKLKDQITDDEFSDRDTVAEPYSTTDFEVVQA